MIKVHGQIIAISDFEQKGKSFSKIILIDGAMLHEIKATRAKAEFFSVGEVVDIPVSVFSFKEKIYYTCK